MEGSVSMNAPARSHFPDDVTRTVVGRTGRQSAGTAGAALLPQRRPRRKLRPRRARTKYRSAVVTQQVQKLEQELGTQLLIRHGRGVTLTQAGSCLMERIDVILSLLNAPLEPAPAPEQTAGTISLALPSEAGAVAGSAAARGVPRRGGRT